MQCSLQSLNDCERSPNRTNLRVNFTEKGEAVKERREKFLTAKYGSHQMSLIRKRLAVEMWLYDELQKLFDPPVSVKIHTNFTIVWSINNDWIFILSIFFKSEAIDVDIDEILDMESDDIRISHLRVGFFFCLLRKWKHIFIECNFFYSEFCPSARDRNKTYRYASFFIKWILMKIIFLCTISMSKTVHLFYIAEIHWGSSWQSQNSLKWNLTFKIVK